MGIFISQVIMESKQMTRPVVGWGDKDRENYDWRSGVFADCPEQTMEDCQTWYYGELDNDDERAWKLFRDYWFWGLLYVAAAGPVFLITLPIQIVLTGFYPDYALPTTGES